MSNICKYLFDEIVFSDNRVVPCGCEKLVDHKEEDYFIKTDVYTREVDIEEYLEKRNEYIQMFQNGETPVFCQKCPKYTPITDEYKKLKEEEFSFSKIYLNHKLNCSSKCIYCSSSQEGDLEKIRINNSKKVYSITPTLSEMGQKGLLNNNTELRIWGGECTEYPKELAEIINVGVKYNCHFKIFTNAFQFSEKIKETVQQMASVEVLISLDCGTKETFKKIKRVDAFDNVIKNLEEYSKLLISNPDFDMRLKYVICPGVNDNIDELKAFLEIVHKLNIKIAYLSINDYWLKRNKDKKVPSSLRELLRYWMNKENFPSVEKNIDYDFIPKDWLEKSLNQQYLHEVVHNIFQQENKEQHYKVVVPDRKNEISRLKLTSQYKEITDGRNVCRYLVEGISFMDNRIIPCSSTYFNDKEWTDNFFLKPRQVMTEDDFILYARRRKKFVQMYLENKEPVFCEDCQQYEPFYDDITDIKDLENYKFSEININHKLTCSCKCTYCCLADGGKLEKFEENKLRTSYNIVPILKQMDSQNLLDVNTDINIEGGECTEYPDELAEIIEYGKKNDSHFKILTNGIIFNEKIKELLEDYSIELVISLESGTKELYEQIKRVDAFDKVTENIGKYSDSASVNDRATLCIKYLICPGVNDNLEEFKQFLDICEQKKVRNVLLSLDRYWFEKNQEQELPPVLATLIKYWFETEEYPSITKNADYKDMPKWWLSKIVEIKEEEEIDESTLFTEITDGRPVCRFLAKEMSFIDNRIVPCASTYWNDKNNADKFFLNPAKRISEKDFVLYKKRRQKFIEMYLDGKEPIFCKDCPLYQPVDDNSFDKDFENWKISQINFDHRLACSSRCIYCCSADGGKLERFEENDRKKSYNVIPLLEALNRQNMIDSHTCFNLEGGECTEYSQNELAGIIDSGIKTNSHFNILTNGVIFREEIAELLENHSVDLILSLDSGTKETYQKVKRTDNFDKAVENIGKYVQSASVNKRANFLVKYLICPGVNDSVEEIKAFLTICEQNNVKGVILSLDRYWFEANMDKEINEVLTRLFRYWFMTADFSSVRRYVDYTTISRWWLDAIIEIEDYDEDSAVNEDIYTEVNQQSLQTQDISEEEKKKLFELNNERKTVSEAENIAGKEAILYEETSAKDSRITDESKLYTILSEEKKVCKNLAKSVFFLDNRIVPCTSSFWNERNNAHKIFLKPRQNMNEEDFLLYEKRRKKFIEMYLNGKEPIFCKDCANYQPVSEDFKTIEDFENLKITKIDINHKLKCSCRCIYCNSADGGKLENFEENELKKSYNVIPMIKAMTAKNLIGSDTHINIIGGECTEYPDNELDNIISAAENKDCHFNILTNGIIFSEKIEELLKNHSATVVIPLDSGTKETFEKVKRVDAFDRVGENIAKYSSAVSSNDKARLVVKYIICPGFNDNVDEIKEFLNICGQNNVKNVLLSLDNYWFEENENKDVPKSIEEIIEYWITTKDCVSVKKEIDYSDIPGWWIKDTIEKAEQKRVTEEKMAKALLCSEITDGRKVCKYLAKEMFFLDNRVVPCPAPFLNENDNPDIYFLQAHKNMTEEDFAKYQKSRKRYIEMYINGKEPIFCKDCERYQPIEEDIQNPEDIENLKLSKVTVNHNLKCSCRCIYCNSADGGKSEIFEENELKKSYNISSMLAAASGQNLIDENTTIEVIGGECTEYPDNELDNIISAAENKNCHFRILTNGIIFSEKIEELLKNYSATVVIPLDSGTKETFEKVKRVDAFDRVGENIAKYSSAVSSNDKARLVVKYIICPGFNDNVDEIKEFLNICGQNNVKNVLLSLDNYWFEENKDKTVPPSIEEIVEYWITTKDCVSVKKEIDYFDIPGWWIKETMDKIEQKRVAEEKTAKALLCSEITDGRKVCKYLAKEIFLLDNRIVPCPVPFLNENYNPDIYFLQAHENMTEEDFAKYQKSRKRYIEMYINGKEPIFCKDCERYQPIEEDIQNSEDIENLKLSKITVTHHLKCSCRCIYCNSADGGNLEKFEENELKPSYNAMPLIAAMSEQNLIDENTIIDVIGGECTEYPDNELDDIIEQGINKNTRFQVLTNAIIFNEKLEELLEDYAIEMIIPLDSGTRETYEKIKRVDAFDKVIENIARYSEAVLLNENAHIHVKYIICPGINDNVEEIKEFLNVCEQNDILYTILSINSYWFEENKDKEPPQSLIDLIKYWKNNDDYRTVQRFTDNFDLKQWWVDKILQM